MEPDSTVKPPVANNKTKRDDLPHCNQSQPMRLFCPCLQTPLERSGLLFCDGISSGLTTTSTATDLMTVLTVADTDTDTTCSGQSTDVDWSLLCLSDKLDRLEKAEQRRLEQLEHLRDYYMLPLLGTPTPPDAWWRATGGMAETGKRSIRTGTSSLRAFFGRKSKKNRQADEHHTTSSASVESLQYSSSSTHSLQNASIHEGLLQSTKQQQQQQQRQRQQQPIYRPTEGNKATVFWPFEMLDRLLTVHTHFLARLRQSQCPKICLQSLVSSFIELVGQLSIYQTYAHSMIGALREFESLALTDEKLANVIELREKNSRQEGLRGLLTTTPISCIWYYGKALQAMRVDPDVLGHLKSQSELDNCLHHLESIARDIWPTLPQIADIQRISTLQRRIVGITESLLVPGQHIHHIDTLECALAEFDEKCRTVYAILLTDRLVLLKACRNRGQLSVYKMLLFSKFTFTQTRATPQKYSSYYVMQPGAVSIRLQPSSKASSIAWRKHLKRLTVVHTLKDNKFAPATSLHVVI
ncbi:hypothetical protein THASP1DRAFT_31271 [Thamnocephalis sphaerospora]|uniref:DH domain-containing protein n=1 Tax=Thamnocephalis sphaerospora TaxID=78915 RepID=A0A4V1IWA9_9FUNG|nr:hypothetical protein THASP1DRAFT_31271 [Thamnocephalis sphaerospora]|eukprot:RKP06919.1 hypothetical protein THASP1DRAFT_31271 [Thamnocephalis sphaerospora]